MRLWFERSYNIDNNVTIGIYAFKHHKDHPYVGYSAYFYFFKWMFVVNWVNNWNAYDLVINKRRRSFTEKFKRLNKKDA